MMRKAAEGLHHGPGQVQEALAEARRICEAEGVTFPDHAEIVVALMSHLLSKQVLFEQVTPTGIAVPQGMSGM